MKANLIKPTMLVAYHLRNLYWHATRQITIGVRCIAIDQNKILLVWHTYRNEWYLPGGGVKTGETLEQAIRREMVEEVGSKLGAVSLQGIFTDLKEGRTDHKVVFVGEIIEFHPIPNKEIEKAEFFPLNLLPDDIAIESRNRVIDFINGSKTGFGVW